MKKEVKFFVLAFLGLFLISFVSAYTYRGYGSGLGYGVSQLIDILEEISMPIAQALFGTTEYMFERLLFMLILVSIIYIVLSKIEMFKGDKAHEKAIRGIITISVGLLSSRFLVESQIIQTMILPYSVLGIVLTSVIPFMIFFFFVINGFPGNSMGNSIMRKILWVFFGVVFLGIWSSRQDLVGEYAWIYSMTAVISFLLLLFDGTIQRIKLRMEYGELKADKLHERIAVEKRKLDELETDYSNNRYTKDQYEKAKKKIEKRIKNFQREL